MMQSGVFCVSAMVGGSALGALYRNDIRNRGACGIGAGVNTMLAGKIKRCKAVDATRAHQGASS